MEIIAALTTIICLSIQGTFNETPPISPCSLSDSNVTTFVPEAKASHVYGDIYEDNNTWRTATCLTPDNYLEEPAYVANVEADLHVRARVADIDYFYFKVPAKSNVHFSGYSHDETYAFSLIACEYSFVDIFSDDNGNYVSRYPTNIVEDFSDSKRKAFNLTLKPGMYYVNILSQQDVNENSRAFYDFSLAVIPVEEDYESSASVRVMKYDKRLKGALWASDFLPLGIEASFITTGEYVIQCSGISGVSYPDYFLEDLCSRSQGQNIEYAALYIWDSDVKKSLATILRWLSQEVYRAAEQLETTVIRLKYEVDSVARTLEVLATIGSSIVSFVFDSASGSVFSAAFDVVVSLTKLFLRFICPKITVSLVKYASFLAMLQGLCEGSADNGGVIRLPFICNLRKQFDNMNPLMNKLYFDFTPTVESFLGSDTHISTSDLLYPSLPNDCCFRGHFYGIASSTLHIREEGDLIPYSEYENIPPQAGTVFMAEPYTVPSLEPGESYWGRFVAPGDGNYFAYTFENGNLNDKMGIDFYSQPVLESDASSPAFSTIYDYYTQGWSIKGKACNFEMNKGDVLYLRLKNKSSRKRDAFSVMVKPGKYTPHYHEYGDVYTWVNENVHSSVCVCGKTKVSGHVKASASSKVCILCGGRAERGFIGMEGTTAYFETCRLYNVARF